ncbi:hypothetical protein EXN66_Car005989 [Channa argus]|uniref:Secreted protein n=1 Tax=Channa argus TaxID=215402 RepID=A0A6G1PJA8_CHAAH|nr:hypothetical protein EXN66_Car005989 [Channa argus]
MTTVSLFLRLTWATCGSNADGTLSREDVPNIWSKALSVSCSILLYLHLLATEEHHCSNGLAHRHLRSSKKEGRGAFKGQQVPKSKLM